MRLFTICSFVGFLVVLSGLATLSGQEELARPVEVPRAAPQAGDEVEQEQDNPQHAAMIQQQKAQYESALQSELHLAILVAELNQTQRESLRETTEAALHDFVRKMVIGQTRGLSAPVVRRVQGRVVLDNADVREINQLTAEPHKALEAIVDQALAKCATPEQIAQIQDERMKRTARLKQVIIANIVTGLDEKLLLTPTQRKQLTELIDRNWNAPNPQLLDQFTFPNNNGWLPIADSLVQSVLTPTQQRVWNERRNQHTVVFNAVGGMGVGMIRVEDAMFEIFDQREEREEKGAPEEPSHDAAGERALNPAVSPPRKIETEAS